jgi:hypothetical protein
MCMMWTKIIVNTSGTTKDWVQNLFVISGLISILAYYLFLEGPNWMR